MSFVPSRTQSPQASWSAGGARRDSRITGIVTAGILRLTVLSFVTVYSPEQPIKKITFFFHYPRVSPGAAR